MAGIFSGHVFGMGQTDAATSTTPALTPTAVKVDLSHFVSPTPSTDWATIMQPTALPPSNMPLIIGGVVAVAALAVVMSMMSGRRVQANRSRRRRRRN